MEAKLEFLKKYRNNVELVNDEMLKNLKDNKIPDYWLDVFKEKDVKIRIIKTIEIWKNFIPKELSNTIMYLEENLTCIELIKINEKFSILYSIRGKDNNIEYYEGKFPNVEFTNKNLLENWKNIPNSIKTFYEKVNNGFYFYASHSMGLVPFDEVTYFLDDEWGILEELDEPLAINLETTFGFFNSGMGGYVAVDFDNCDDGKGVLWFTSRQPKYNINFWDFVDEWIVIGFQS